jgi:hypothetical protein
MSVYSGPEISNSGLVLCLDAGNTKSYLGSGTTWTDLSGLGNNGTLTNGPTFSSDNGGSMVFDGVNDYVAMGNILKFTRTEQATISTWFNISSYSNPNFIIARRITGGNRTDYSQVVRNSTTISYLFDDDGRTGINNGDPTYYDWTVSQMSAGNWYNFTIKLLNNGSWGSVTGYFNGSELSTLNGPHDDYSSNELVLGRNHIINLGSPVYFNGKIGVVQIYNRALSNTEIQQNFNALRGRFNI